MFHNILMVFKFLIQQKPIKWILLPLLVLSLISISAYIFFKDQYIKPADGVVFFEKSEALESLFVTTGEQSQPMPITVVYFWQANCPCDGGVLPHFYTLMSKFSSAKVRFLLANLGDGDELIPQVPRLPDEPLALVEDEVQYTPSVGVWNQQGEMVYFGPHSLGYVCNARTSFLQKVLENINEGASSANLNTLGDGCFCARQD